jgi:formylglycine-generating enzyme required for sulfatase activity
VASGPEPTLIDPVSGIELVLLPAGEFVMGTPNHEPLREPGERQHHVTLSRPFYLGRYEVTQEQWQRVMGNNPSTSRRCPRCPVDTVSALDIERFLAQVANQGGLVLRLPSEAEWEYACRAGTSTPFSVGATLSDAQANIDALDPYPGGASGGKLGHTVAVGSYPANSWGLFDLHGNVWEWTSDLNCPYAADPVIDPSVATCSSPLRIIRGGSWHYGADSARCGLRYTHRPQDDGPSLGFRVALDAPPS